MNDLLFRKRHAFVMQYLTNNVAVAAMICLTTCLSGHLEWWECLNMYKMHSISHMEPKCNFFSDTLNQKMHDLTMKPLFICKDLPLNLCVRKLRIHNSLNYQNRQNTFWDIWKNARGGLTFLVECIWSYSWRFIPTRHVPETREKPINGYERAERASRNFGTFAWLRQKRICFF